VALLGLLGAGAWACGRSPIGSGTAVEGEPASVVLELKESPADILCVTLTIAGVREEKRRLDVPADGPATFVLRRLPLGLVVFSAEAHPTACAGLADGAEGTWTGGPVSARLVAGPNGTVTIQMVPAVRAGVSITWDAGAGQTCAAVGAACATSDNCCPGASCVLGAEGLGRCQPVVAASDAGAAPDVTPDTMPDAGPPAVSVQLTGGEYYIVYPANNPTDCQRANTQIYVATLNPGDAARCIPNGLGALVPTRVRLLQVCTPGGSCAPCTGGSCLPQGCFQQLPPPNFLGCGGSLPAPTGPDPITYVLFQDLQAPGTGARPPAREGIPMVVTAPGTGMMGSGVSDVVIRPPAGYGPIVIGNLLVQPGAPGDSCGLTSMCGVLPLWGASAFSFTSWSLFQSTGSGLTFWSF
jgi:hypothetical protein